MTPAVKWIIWAQCRGVRRAIRAIRGITGYLGLIPAGGDRARWIWQLVTYMFLHEGVTHILFNMLGIWMFGVELERMWGTQLLPEYYAITGVGAAITTLVVALLPFAVDCGDLRRRSRSARRARSTACCSRSRSITPSGRS